MNPTVHISLSPRRGEYTLRVEMSMRQGNTTHKMRGRAMVKDLLRGMKTAEMSIPDMWRDLRAAMAGGDATADSLKPTASNGGAA